MIVSITKPTQTMQHSFSYKERNEKMKISKEMKAWMREQLILLPVAVTVLFLMSIDWPRVFGI